MRTSFARRGWRILAALAALTLPASLAAQAVPLPYGLQMEAGLTSDLFTTRGASGDTTVHLHNARFALLLDGGALGWGGGRAMVQLLMTRGQSLSDVVGDLQGVSNIEAPADFRLYQAWVEQSFRGGDAAILVGLYDLNADFYVVEHASLFLHSSQGIGAEIAQTGDAGPSIFPWTSFAVAGRVALGDDVTLRGAVVDAVPGLPGRPDALGVHLSRREGALLITEVAWQPDVRFRMAGGAWGYTWPVRPEWDRGSLGRPSRGGYLIAEADLIGGGDVGPLVEAFARVGIADEDLHQIGLGWGGGLTGSRVVPGRPDDRVGFAISSAHLSSVFRHALGESRRSGVETAFEFVYRMALGAGIAIAMDVQWIDDPGAVGAREGVLALGQRLIVEF